MSRHITLVSGQKYAVSDTDAEAIQQSMILNGPAARLVTIEARPVFLAMGAVIMIETDDQCVDGIA